jgi:Tat protein secretion system quality control protein TatD with DNase activity
VIDTHAHLTSLEDTDEAIRRAAEAVVTRILTVGTGRRGLPPALSRSPSGTTASSRS